MNNITSSTEFSLPLDQSPQAMKKILCILSFLFSASILAQTPAVEIGGGLALKHTEGFYIPRYTVSGINLFRGIGIYTTYEQRNDVVFVDDFNGDGNYQRYTVGPTLTLNQNLYAFAGLSPLGPYGLTHSFGKVRKEIGLGLVFNPITLRLGYSNWVGTTVGVHYRFGQSSTPISFQSKGAVRGRKSSPSALPEREVITRVDTIVVREEVIKEVPVEVIKEVEKPLELTQIAVLYFEFNSTTYTRESQLLLEEVVKTIKANPSEDIVLIGHTDEVGTDAYNYTLGLNRAQKLANFLVNRHGVNSSLIEVRSEGLKRPFANDDPNKNRRVVVYFKR